MERRNKAAQFNLHETNVMVMIRILHVCGFGTKKKNNRCILRRNAFSCVWEMDGVKINGTCCDICSLRRFVSFTLTLSLFFLSLFFFLFISNQIRIKRGVCIQHVHNFFLLEFEKTNEILHFRQYAREKNSFENFVILSNSTHNSLNRTISA